MHNCKNDSLGTNNDTLSVFMDVPFSCEVLGGITANRYLSKGHDELKFSAAI